MIIKALASESEIPDFLKLNQKIDCFSDSGEDSISTACMYTEMTLKNSALYAPKFPVLTAPIAPPQPVSSKPMGQMKPALTKGTTAASAGDKFSSTRQQQKD